MRPKGFSVIPHMLAQYIWIIVFYFPMIALIGFRTSTLTRDFFSHNGDSNSSNYRDPTWFLHLTNWELNARKGDEWESIRDILRTAVSEIRPYKIFVSGDVVANEENTRIFKHIRQRADDWQLYDKVIDDLHKQGIKDEDLFIVAGNLDVFGVSSFHSKQNYARRILANSSSEYGIKVSSFNIHGNAFRVISLNPYSYPTLPYGLGTFAFPSIAIRERIRELISLDNESTTILLAYHPAGLWHPSYDTDQQNSLKQLLIGSRRTRLLLTGSLNRGSQPTFKHYGNVLEVMGAPFSKYLSAGVVTFDNERMVYHQVPLRPELNKSKPLVLLTNPPPFQQASSLDVFNQRHLVIRAIAFSREYLVLNVSGAIRGTLVKQKDLTDGVQLYSMGAELSFGSHTLELSGDWSGRCEFVIGHTVSGFSEADYATESTAGYEFAFAWSWIILFFITVPVGLSGIGDEYELWIEGKSDNTYWILAIFGGFLTVKKWISKSEKWFSVILFISTLWPVLGPFLFFWLDGKLALFWLYGVESNGKHLGLFIGAKVGLCYLWTVVLPVALMAGSISVTKGRSWVVIVDGLVYLVAIGGNCWLIAYLANIIGITALLGSPLLLIPVILHVSLWIRNFRFLGDVKKRRNDEYVLQTVTRSSFV